MVDQMVDHMVASSACHIPNPKSQSVLRTYRATAHEIAAALAYLHSQDLLHGDLTGGNILLASTDADERGFCAKVADFGLSRTLGSEPVDTGTYGTVTHMPPELLTTGEMFSTSVFASLLSCIRTVMDFGHWDLLGMEPSLTCPLSCSLCCCHRQV